MAISFLSNQGPVSLAMSVTGESHSYTVALQVSFLSRPGRKLSSGSLDTRAIHIHICFLASLHYCSMGVHVIVPPHKNIASPCAVH